MGAYKVMSALEIMRPVNEELLLPSSSLQSWPTGPRGLVDGSTLSTVNAAGESGSIASLLCDGWSLPPVKLTQSDEVLLSDFEVRFRSCGGGGVKDILHELSHLRMELLEDFPAEVFLARTAIIGRLLSLIRSSPSLSKHSRSDVNVDNDGSNVGYNSQHNKAWAVTEDALRTVSRLMQGLISSCKLYFDPMLRPAVQSADPGGLAEAVLAYRYPCPHPAPGTGVNYAGNNSSMHAGSQRLSVSGLVFGIFLSTVQLLRRGDAPYHVKVSAAELLLNLIPLLREMPTHKSGQEGANSFGELDAARFTELLAQCSMLLDIESTRASEVTLIHAVTLRLLEQVPASSCIPMMSDVTLYATFRAENIDGSAECSAETSFQKVIVPLPVLDLLRRVVQDPDIAENLPWAKDAVLEHVRGLVPGALVEVQRVDTLLSFATEAACLDKGSSHVKINVGAGSLHSREELLMKDLQKVLDAAPFLRLVSEPSIIWNGIKRWVTAMSQSTTYSTNTIINRDTCIHSTDTCEKKKDSVITSSSREQKEVSSLAHDVMCALLWGCGSSVRNVAIEALASLCTKCDGRDKEFTTEEIHTALLHGLLLCERPLLRPLLLWAYCSDNAGEKYSRQDVNCAREVVRTTLSVAATVMGRSHEPAIERVQDTRRALEPLQPLLMIAGLKEGRVVHATVDGNYDMPTVSVACDTIGTCLHLSTPPLHNTNWILSQLLRLFHTNLYVRTQASAELWNSLSTESQTHTSIVQLTDPFTGLNLHGGVSSRNNMHSCSMQPYSVTHFKDLLIVVEAKNMDVKLRETAASQLVRMLAGVKTSPSQSAVHPLLSENEQNGPSEAQIETLYRVVMDELLAADGLQKSPDDGGTHESRGLHNTVMDAESCLLLLSVIVWKYGKVCSALRTSDKDLGAILRYIFHVRPRIRRLVSNIAVWLCFRGWANGTEYFEYLGSQLPITCGTHAELVNCADVEGDTLYVTPAVRECFNVAFHTHPQLAGTSSGPPIQSSSLALEHVTATVPQETQAVVYMLIQRWRDGKAEGVLSVPEQDGKTVAVMRAQLSTASSHATFASALTQCRVLLATNPSLASEFVSSGVPDLFHRFLRTPPTTVRDKKALLDVLTFITNIVPHMSVETSLSIAQHATGCMKFISHRDTQMRAWDPADTQTETQSRKPDMLNNSMQEAVLQLLLRLYSHIPSVSTCIKPNDIITTLLHICSTSSAGHGSSSGSYSNTYCSNSSEPLHTSLTLWNSQVQVRARSDVAPSTRRLAWDLITAVILSNKENVSEGRRGEEVLVSSMCRALAESARTCLPDSFRGKGVVRAALTCARTYLASVTSLTSPAVTELLISSGGSTTLSGGSGPSRGAWLLRLTCDRETGTRAMAFGMLAELIKAGVRADVERGRGYVDSEPESGYGLVRAAVRAGTDVYHESQVVAIEALSLACDEGMAICNAHVITRLGDSVVAAAAGMRKGDNGATLPLVHAQLHCINVGLSKLSTQASTAPTEENSLLHNERPDMENELGVSLPHVINMLWRTGFLRVCVSLLDGDWWKSAVNETLQRCCGVCVPEIEDAGTNNTPGWLSIAQGVNLQTRAEACVQTHTSSAALLRTVLKISSTHENSTASVSVRNLVLSHTPILTLLMRTLINLSTNKASRGWKFTSFQESLLQETGALKDDLLQGDLEQSSGTGSSTGGLGLGLASGSHSAYTHVHVHIYASDLLPRPSAIPNAIVKAITCMLECKATCKLETRTTVTLQSLLCTVLCIPRWVEEIDLCTDVGQKLVCVLVDGWIGACKDEHACVWHVRAQALSLLVHTYYTTCSEGHHNSNIQHTVRQLVACVIKDLDALSSSMIKFKHIVKREVSPTETAQENVSQPTRTKTYTHSKRQILGPRNSPNTTVISVSVNTTAESVTENSENIFEKDSVLEKKNFGRKRGGLNKLNRDGLQMSKLGSDGSQVQKEPVRCTASDGEEQQKAVACVTLLSTLVHVSGDAKSGALEHQLAQLIWRLWPVAVANEAPGMPKTNILCETLQMLCNLSHNSSAAKRALMCTGPATHSSSSTSAGNVLWPRGGGSADTLFHRIMRLSLTLSGTRTHVAELASSVVQSCVCAPPCAAVVIQAGYLGDCIGQILALYGRVRSGRGAKGTALDAARRTASLLFVMVNISLESEGRATLLQTRGFDQLPEVVLDLCTRTRHPRTCTAMLLLFRNLAKHRPPPALPANLPTFVDMALNDKDECVRRAAASYVAITCSSNTNVV